MSKDSALSINKDSTYLLQYSDELSEHIWEVDLRSEPAYVRRKPQYKFLTSGVNIDYDTNILEIKIISRNELNKSILKRVVLIEKINHKTQETYGDPITEWSFKKMFSSNPFGNNKNFKLLKINTSGTVLQSWLLSECLLMNSTIWTNFENNKTSSNHTIWIKPNAILKCL